MAIADVPLNEAEVALLRRLEQGPIPLVEADIAAAKVLMRHQMLDRSIVNPEVLKISKLGRVWLFWH